MDQPKQPETKTDEEKERERLWWENLISFRAGCIAASGIVPFHGDPEEEKKMHDLNLDQKNPSP